MDEFLFTGSCVLLLIGFVLYDWFGPERKGERGNGYSNPTDDWSDLWLDDCDIPDFDHHTHDWWH
jgi:hypothetical protein